MLPAGYFEAWTGQGGYVFGGDQLYRFVPAVGKFEVGELVSPFYEGLVFELAEAVLERRRGRVETLEVPGGVEDHGDVGLVAALGRGHQAIAPPSERCPS